MNEQNHEQLYKIVIALLLLVVLSLGLCVRFEHKRASSRADSAITSTMDRAQNAITDARNTVDNAKGEANRAGNAISSAKGTSSDLKQSTDDSGELIKQCQSIVDACTDTARRINQLIDQVEGTTTEGGEG
mgnify:CR=1 FL=1